MKKTEIYIHTKTGGEYIILSHSSRIKFEGKWFDAIIYTQINSLTPFEYFVRKIEDFESNFHLKIDE